MSSIRYITQSVVNIVEDQIDAVVREIQWDVEERGLIEPGRWEEFKALLKSKSHVQLEVFRETCSGKSR